MSTSEVETWQTLNIWTKNVTEVSKWFLFLNSSTTYETIENLSTKFKKAENSGTNKVFNPKIYGKMMKEIQISVSRRRSRKQLDKCKLSKIFNI
jgi:hypothetical protein